MAKTATKPVVLFFPFDLLSHYSRCIQLANSIKHKFDIRFLASDKYDAMVKSAGFKLFQSESFDPERVLSDSRRFRFSWLNYSNLKRIFLSQVEIIQKLNPVLVVGDTAPTLKMAAEFTQTQHVSIMNGYMSKYYALTRNISKTHPAAILRNELPEKLFESMTRTGEQVAFHLIQRAFNKLRKEKNLPKQKMYLDELEGDFNIICDDPAMFPQKNLPQNYRIIGPLFYQSDAGEPEIIKFLQNDKPSILANVGSSGDLNKFSFLKNEFFNNFNIVLTGEMSDQLKGSHIINRKFINNSAFLDKIDLVLCHAGNGTVYQSLAYGVPIVCATSIFEQEWNAKRVEDMGLGQCIDDIKTDSEKIEIVKKWLEKKDSEKFKKLKDNIKVEVSINNFKKFITEIFK